MQNVGFTEGFIDLFLYLLGFGSCRSDDVGDSALAHVEVKESFQGIAEALIGEELVAVEIDAEGLEIRSVLHGCGGLGGKICREGRFAMLALALLSLMLSDDNVDGRDIKNLSVLSA